MGDENTRRIGNGFNSNIQDRILISLAENSPEFFGVSDLELKPIYVNPAGRRLVGLDEAAPGAVVTDFFYPEDRPFIEQEFFPRVRRDGFGETEIRFRNFRTGEPVWMIYTVFLVRGERGEPLGFGTVSRDVTERRRMVEALRCSEELYRHLFSAIDEAFCIVELIFDEDGRPFDYRFLEVNPAFEKVTGLRDAAGRTANELVRNLEVHWSETLGRVVRTQQPERFTNRSDAMGFWFDLYAFPIEEPEKGKVAILFNNITDRKEAEEEIRRLSEHNRAILESITDAFFAIDHDWRFTYANSQAERLLEREPGDLLGKVLWEVYPGLVGSDFEKVYRQTAEKRVSSTITSYYPDHERWYEARCYPAANGITIYFRDVTERKRAEEALMESDRRKDEFLATLAHELRNPLAPIRSGLEVIRRVDTEREELFKTLEIIERQTNQVVHLVDDLLDISRITQGKIRLRRERIELRTAIDMALETSRELIDRAENELTITYPFKPIYIEADLTRVAQIFLNVLNNAAKYSTPGGHISLVVKRAGSEAQVSIRDTGLGIAPEMLSKIFEMFGQIQTPDEEARGGLGIGLSVAKKLIEMHGGTIEALSEGVGRGSEFVIRFPLAAEQSEPLVKTNGEAADKSAYPAKDQKSVPKADGGGCWSSTTTPTARACWRRFCCSKAFRCARNSSLTRRSRRRSCTGRKYVCSTSVCPDSTVTSSPAACSNFCPKRCWFRFRAGDARRTCADRARPASGGISSNRSRSRRFCR
jgi:PAS domain S-box-containing protein